MARRLRPTKLSERIMDTFRVTLQEYRNVFAPYRVDNCTRSLIGYYQKNCETEEEFLRPYGSTVYTWDEPTLSHQLVVKLPGHGVLAFIDVDFPHGLVMLAGSDDQEREDGGDKKRTVHAHR